MTLIISGVTGSGKTEVAERICGRSGRYVIISADSRCFYREVGIGNGKFTMDLSLPYEMVDIVGPDSLYTVFDFVSDARMVMERTSGQGKHPIVCGGSMLHLDRLVHGMEESPRPDPGFRGFLDAFIDENGVEEAHRMLQEIDRNAAFGIHPRDRTRIERTLEKALFTEGACDPIPPMGLPPVAVFLDRDDLDLMARIRRRTARMIETGWPEEVSRLEAVHGRGHSPGADILGSDIISDAIRSGSGMECAIGPIVSENMMLVRSQRRWAERIGLEVMNVTGLDLGRVSTTLEARYQASQE